jgi:hypothetical protein
MGQTKPVTTIRYFMRGSIEEVRRSHSANNRASLTSVQNIVRLQKRKLRLASLALSGEEAPVESAYLEVSSLPLLLAMLRY